MSEAPTAETVAPDDFIHFDALSGDTRLALREWLRSIDRDDLADRAWWDFNEFCGMWFRLRAQEDDPELFPRGKFATLQRMEGLIAEAIAGRGAAR